MLSTVARGFEVARPFANKRHMMVVRLVLRHLWLVAGVALQQFAAQALKFGLILRMLRAAFADVGYHGVGRLA